MIVSEECFFRRRISPTAHACRAALIATWCRLITALVTGNHVVGTQRLISHTFVGRCRRCLVFGGVTEDCAPRHNVPAAHFPTSRPKRNGTCVSGAVLSLNVLNDSWALMRMTTLTLFKALPSRFRILDSKLDIVMTWRPSHLLPVLSP